MMAPYTIALVTRSITGTGPLMRIQKIKLVLSYVNYSPLLSSALNDRQKTGFIVQIRSIQDWTARSAQIRTLQHDRIPSQLPGNLHIYRPLYVPEILKQDAEGKDCKEAEYKGGVCWDVPWAEHNACIYDVGVPEHIHTAPMAFHIWHISMIHVTQASKGMYGSHRVVSSKRRVVGHLPSWLWPNSFSTCNECIDDEYIYIYISYSHHQVE